MWDKHVPHSTQGHRLVDLGTLSGTLSELKMTDDNVIYDEASNKYTFQFDNIDIGDYTVKETTTDIPDTKSKNML